MRSSRTLEAKGVLGYGLSWRDFAVVEITRALTSAATDRRRRMNKVESDGIACSHEGYA
jgi:hypothetical protein